MHGKPTMLGSKKKLMRPPLILTEPQTYFAYSAFVIPMSQMTAPTLCWLSYNLHLLTRGGTLNWTDVKNSMSPNLNPLLDQVVFPIAFAALLAVLVKRCLQSQTEVIFVVLDALVRICEHDLITTSNMTARTKTDCSYTF